MAIYIVSSVQVHIDSYSLPKCRHNYNSAVGKAPPKKPGFEDPVLFRHNPGVIAVSFPHPPKFCTFQPLL